MKKLSMLGIVVGAALMTAAPFTIDWSHKSDVALSIDRADGTTFSRRAASRELTAEFTGGRLARTITHTVIPTITDEEDATTA